MINKKTSVLKSANLKWNQQRRLEFIDYRLCWSGRINRADLVNFFGISIPQSSLDLSDYITMAPDNLVYDRHDKVYLRSETFKPLFAICEPSRYLNDILLSATGSLPAMNNYLERVPSVACFVPPKRNIDFLALYSIVKAIFANQSLTVQYQSMNDLTPRMRLIAPHAFGFDGIRWHVRAYCFEHKEFRDFVLSRISGVGEFADSDINPAEDMKWNFVVSIHVGANPNLSPAARKAIEMDFGMENGEVVFKCRQALLFYYLRTLRLSPADDKDNSDPDSKQLVLKNKKEIYMLLTM